MSSKRQKILQENVESFRSRVKNAILLTDVQCIPDAVIEIIIDYSRNMCKSCMDPSIRVLGMDGLKLDHPEQLIPFQKVAIEIYDELGSCFSRESDCFTRIDFGYTGVDFSKWTATGEFSWSMLYNQKWKLDTEAARKTLGRGPFYPSQTLKKLVAMGKTFPLFDYPAKLILTAEYNHYDSSSDD
jgi:hypothetical protein